MFRQRKQPQSFFLQIRHSTLETVFPNLHGVRKTGITSDTAETEYTVHVYKYGISYEKVEDVINNRTKWKREIPNYTGNPCDGKSPRRIWESSHSHKGKGNNY